MRVIAIAAILLVGCASRTAGTSSPTNLDQAQESLDRSEVLCIEEAVMRADDQMRNVVMTLGALTQLEIQEVLLRRVEGARQCRTLAEKGEAGIASRERVSYENAEALDRKIPVPVLTWSLSPP
jgi:PBP1b-binding outer membrane lipoprotein LpoB